MQHLLCIFCQIISGQVPAEVIHETADLIVIKDIAPKAPIHYLIIPKKHIATLQAFSQEDTLLAGAMLQVTQAIVKKTGVDDFKIVINNGSGAGQVVFHTHCHFLSGEHMKSLI